MSYTDGKAAGRRTPGSTPEGATVAPAPSSKDSNQLKVEGQSSKFHTYSTAPNTGVAVGNQVRVGVNTKGTGVTGRPSSIALAGKDLKKPAVENPSGSRNAPGKF